MEEAASQVAWLSGRSDDALAHARSQLEISQRISTLMARAGVFGTLGAALVECGQGDDAIRAVESSSGARFGLPDLVLAQARLALGLPEQASAAAEASVALAVANGCKLLELRARCTLARVRLRTRPAAARDVIEAELARADALVEETGARGLAPFVLAERAALARALGDEAGWEDRLREAQRLWAALGAPARVDQIEAELRAVPRQSP